MDVQYTYSWRVNQSGTVSILFCIGSRYIRIQAANWSIAQSKIEAVKNLLDSQFNTQVL